jgi:V/A-type H+/Na+-transporting ATPase subunit E
MANLAALLEKEASAEIEAILSEARERASELVAKAKTEAEGVVLQGERAARSQYEASLVRAKSSAQLEASSLRLRGRQDALERVLASVKDQITALSRDPARYESVLGKLLAEAVTGLGGKDKVESIFVNPADIALAEKVAAQQGLSSKVRSDESVRGGVRLRAAGSNVTVENTLQGRLEAMRDELTSTVSRVLFGEGA